jgi:hypothetical protein
MENKGLFDYAGEHQTAGPGPDQQDIDESAQAYQTEEFKRERIDQMKKAILHQLQNGDTPADALYWSLWIVGQITEDEAWTKACHDTILSEYGEDAIETLNATMDFSILAQQSEAMRRTYINGTLNTLKRAHDKWKAAGDSILDTLQAVGELNVFDPHRGGNTTL